MTIWYFVLTIVFQAGEPRLEQQLRFEFPTAAACATARTGIATSVLFGVRGVPFKPREVPPRSLAYGLSVCTQGKDGRIQ